jgi:hypothetical protein
MKGTNYEYMELCADWCSCCYYRRGFDTEEKAGLENQ